METIGRKIVADNHANVILMDYSAISSCNYVYLAKKITPDLGEYLAKSILRWQLQLNETRIIGHSLGAHVAGEAGTFLTRISRQQLARIDGSSLFDIFSKQ